MRCPHLHAKAHQTEQTRGPTMPMLHSFMLLPTVSTAFHNTFHRISQTSVGSPPHRISTRMRGWKGKRKGTNIMFLLRRRVDSFSYHPSNAVGDVVSNGTSSASATPTNILRQRQKSAVSNGRAANGLTETEKARISIYLRLFHAVAAILSTVFCVVKDNSFAAVEFVRAKGIRELLYLATAVVVTAGFLTVSLALYASILLYQTFAWLLSSYLLANVSFFSVHPHPPWSPSSRRPTDVPSSSNLATLDTLIDLSSRSSDAGDTPPPVLAPQVLSPTQLAVRSLSPAFNASMNSDRSAEVEELLNQPTKASPPPAPLSLASILAKRQGTASLLTTANRPIRLREMSTVSYPDINRSEAVDASDEESTSAGQMMDNNTYQSEQDDLSNLYEDEDEEEGMQFPLPEVESHEMPYSSSPTQLVTSLGPESIQVLDPESRQATLDATSIVAMPEPQPHVRTGSESSTFAWAPPPSRVATLASEPSSNVNPTDSPRDIFSPTQVTMPQPQSLSSLSFSLPFLLPNMPQPASIAVVEKEEQVQEAPVKKEEGDILEPTPYPSPPFTPPSSRPPTMYSSMNLQMPSVGDRNELDFVNADPLAREKVRLSALVEEVKTELEAIERSTPAPEPIKDEAAVEPETPENVEEDKVEPEVAQEEQPAAAPEPTIVASVKQPTMTVHDEEEPETVPPAYTEFAPELPTVDEAEVPPPRRHSPVMSIGRGGFSTGSRINVDDLTAPSWKAEEESSVAATQDKTLVGSPEEEKLNEVGEVVEVTKEDEVPVPLEMPSVGSIDRSGWGSGADDESTAPKTKLDMRNKKKKKSKSKRPEAKKGVSFDDTPFVIGSDKEQVTTVDENETQDEEERKPVLKKGRIFELALNDLGPRAPSPSVIPSPSVSRAIPVPKTFEIEEEEEAVPPTLIPRYSSPPPMEPVRGSPVTSPAPSRRVSMLSEMMSPRSTADELSDSSSVMVLAPGEFTAKQVDQYARWFARAHRDKSLPTVPMLRTQMKECTESELTMRLKLGSRAESTKLTKELLGEGYSSSGKGAPPIRKNSSYRSRRSTVDSPKKRNSAMIEPPLV